MKAKSYYGVRYKHVDGVAYGVRKMETFSFTKPAVRKNKKNEFTIWFIEESMRDQFSVYLRW